MKEIEKITSDAEYQNAINWLDKQLDKQIDPNSPEGLSIKHVLLLVKEYEDLHYPIGVKRFKSWSPNTESSNTTSVYFFNPLTP